VFVQKLQLNNDSNKTHTCDGATAPPLALKIKQSINHAFVKFSSVCVVDNALCTADRRDVSCRSIRHHHHSNHPTFADGEFVIPGWFVVVYRHARAEHRGCWWCWGGRVVDCNKTSADDVRGWGEVGGG